MISTALTLAARLGPSFVLLAIVIVLASRRALQALDASRRRVEDQIHHAPARARLAVAIMAAAGARAIAMRNLVLLTDADAIADEHERFRAAHRKVEKHAESLGHAIARSTQVGAQERALFVEFERVEARYGPLALEIAELAMHGHRQAAVARMNVLCRPLLAELTATATAYARYDEDRARACMRELRAGFARQRIAMLLLGMAAALLTGWLLWRHLSADALPASAGIELAG